MVADDEVDPGLDHGRDHDYARGFVEQARDAKTVSRTEGR